MIVLVKTNEDPKDTLARSNLQLVEPSLTLLGSLRNNTVPKELDRMHAFCMKLERAARSAVDGSEARRIGIENEIDGLAVAAVPGDLLQDSILPDTFLTEFIDDVNGMEPTQNGNEMQRQDLDIIDSFPGEAPLLGGGIITFAAQ